MDLIDLTYKYAKGRDPEHVVPSIKEKRMSICKKCPLYGSYVKGFCGNGVTEGCGCKLTLKTRYKNENCPNGLW